MKGPKPLKISVTNHMNVYSLLIWDLLWSSCSPGLLPSQWFQSASIMPFHNLNTGLNHLSSQRSPCHPPLRILSSVSQLQFSTEYATTVLPSCMVIGMTHGLLLFLNQNFKQAFLFHYCCLYFYMVLQIPESYWTSVGESWREERCGLILWNVSFCIQTIMFNFQNLFWVWPLLCIFNNMT